METPAILPRSVKLCAVLSGKALWESCGGQEVGTGQKGLKIEDGREQAWPLGATASSFMSGREYSFQSNMLIKSLAQRSQGMGNGGGRGGRTATAATATGRSWKNWCVGSVSCF